MRRALPATLRRLLLAVGLIALIVAAVQISIGGFRIDVFGLRLSNRSLARPLLLVLLVAGVVLRRADRAATLIDLERLDRLLGRGAPWIAAAAAGAALAIGFVWGTRAAGGSDSYCYIGQAEEFAAGRAILIEPLARQVALPHADLVFAPVGFVPGPTGGAVPMCAPGLSLVMAVAWKVGGDATLHAVVPGFGALCVWCAFLLGRRLHSPIAGASAAILLCLSPVFLYQLVQPMSDVPAAALWSAALVLVARETPRGQIGGGVLASLAILTRPNLAPVLMPICCFLFISGGRAALTRFTLALVPGCTLLAWLNQVRYGSPWRTGYGDVDALFSVANLLPNATRYGEWTIGAQTPFILLALAAPILLRSRPAARVRYGGVSAFPWTGVAYVSVVVACYLPYTVFDAWWYTRFLLPALPIALALASASLVAVISRVGLPTVMVLPVIAALAAGYLTYARSQQVFALRDFERRFITTGTSVGRTLPENAVLITIQQSGAVRHYGRRPAALWDALAADGLDEAVTEFERVGRKPFLLLEDWEEKGFRERFRGERLGALDWPPAAEIRGHVTVRLYDPAAALRSGPR